MSKNMMVMNGLLKSIGLGVDMSKNVELFKQIFEDSGGGDFPTPEESAVVTDVDLVEFGRSVVEQCYRIVSSYPNLSPGLAASRMKEYFECPKV